MCDAPLSIPEPDSKVFLNIFPNPSSGMVEIRSTQNGQLEIFNTLGKTLRISTKTHFAESLDLSKWPSGIYFVTLKTEKGSVTQKIMLGL